MTLAERWNEWLDESRALGRYRRLSLPRGIDCSSNDYLGFGTEEKGPETFVSSGLASRLLRGQHSIWEEVEAELARWHGVEHSSGKGKRWNGTITEPFRSHPVGNQSHR